MNKVRLYAVLICLFCVGMGSFAATQGDSVRAFLLVGTGSTVALILAASAGPPRPPSY